MVKVAYEDLTSFYDDIKSITCGRKSCSVLILVTNEIDAISSTRMLTQLLRNDNIAYSISSVIDTSDFQDISISNDVKCIFMINCGATLNVAKIFSLEQGGDLRCFILDNHRPIHLANVYSRHNVVIFDSSKGNTSEEEEDKDSIPSDGSILSIDSDDSATSDEDEETVSIESNFNESNYDIENDEDEEIEGDRDSDNDEGASVNSSTEKSPKRNNENAEEHSTVHTNNNYVTEDIHTSLNDENISHDNLNDKLFTSSNEVDTQDAEDVEEDDHEDEDIILPKKRQKIVISSIKLRSKRLKDYYFQNPYHSTPTSIVVMNLACSRSGSGIPTDVLWQGALGAYDQYERGNISDDVYDLMCDRIRLLLTHHFDLSHSSGKYIVSDEDNNTETVVTAAETGNIIEGDDYRFFLMRHWSLYKSILHSPYILLKLTAWKSHGVQKIQELLAKAGVPLEQAMQSFMFISPDLRNRFLQELQNESTKRLFNLYDPDVSYRSFYRHTSFKMAVSTGDVVVASSSFIESSMNFYDMNSLHANSDSDPENKANNNINKIEKNRGFNDAYDCLGTKSEDLLKQGIDRAITIQSLIIKKASAILDNYDAITRVSKMYFSYVYRLGPTLTQSHNIPISDENRQHDFDTQYIFYNTNVLYKLGALIMNIKMNLLKKEGGWTGARLLPLFLLSEKKETVIVFGISPLSFLSETSQIYDQSQVDVLKRFSNFHLYFSLAAKDLKVYVKFKLGFNPNICEVSKRDIQDFLMTLDYLFKKAIQVREIKN